ncbi:flagellar hook protein FlgE [Vibrio sp. D431a]|uniref:flagellar hook protein FlgE n=1 Tax=Vibrio sp. D431a TaxID=2837388 RepID=UPI0025574030|nr:flagellar hook-basal body complex protein [Vibrio sp. D431a]MDK9793908.1 flagellar hook-basal body complex protein [Vibrio sp. D431a]
MDYTKIALSGINGANRAIGNTSNNIANSETIGFKQTSMQFSQMVVKNGANGTGVGVGSGAVSTNHNGGSMVPTGNALHQAISGEGYFVVENENGEQSLTRNGAFEFDKDGYLVDGYGNHVQGFGSGSTALQDIKIDETSLPPVITDSGSLEINFGNDMTDPTDEIVTSVKVFDSLGDSQNLNIKFKNYSIDPVTSEATWEIEASVDGKAVALTPNTVHFNDKGELIKGKGAIDGDGKFELNLGTLTPALPGVGKVEMDISKSTGYAGNTTIKSQNSNGRTYAEYDGYQVEADGSIVFSYAGGETKEVATIAMANVKNPDGLVMGNNGYYSVGIAAGDVFYGKSGDTGFGNMYSGYLEGSNVDMTAELVNLISLQKMFQSNSKVLGVAKETNNALMQAV